MMGHRKWSLFGAGAESMEGAMREHNALFQSWEVERDRATDMLDENNRLDRELDEARKRITELEAMLASEVADNARLRAREVGDEVGNLLQELADANNRIAELSAPPVINNVTGLPTGEYVPIRVPFSDDQIERMARGLRQSYCEHYGVTADGALPDYYKELVRAALAAGGLEPCAVPEYEPDDVALAPTGHVLRYRLVEAEAKIERQRKNLRQLYEARERDARLIADLRAEVDEDNAAAASVNDLLIKVQNLTAERDALRERASVPVPAGVPGVEELVDIGFGGFYSGHSALSFANCAQPTQWAASATAIRDAVLAGVAAEKPIDPPTDQVEALARVLCRWDAHDEPHEDSWTTTLLLDQNAYRHMARAAIAHLAKRPEGLPTAEEIKAAHLKYVAGYHKGENDGSMCATDFALDYLRPWLRDPVGWELDVTADEALRVYARNHKSISGMQAVLDLCRARIKPVYECKECAELRKTVESLQGLAEQASEIKRELDKEQERGMALYRQYESVEAMFHNQRKINTELKDYMARLDGSPLAARAALEGENNG